MRHAKSGRKFGRTSSHRSAMMRNATVSLFRYERIITTLTKAKELRRFAEPLITLARKDNSVANKRLAFSRLRSRQIVQKLFSEFATRYKDRPGGYLRILKSGHRAGDGATLALVELMDSPKTIEASKTEET